MRIRIRSAALLALAFVVGSCSDSRGVVAPVAASTSPGAPSLSVGAAAALPSVPPVRISEIHYDNGGPNNGLDVGEAIEVSAPAGTSLTGWTIVLYNGAGGAVYDADAIGGLTPKPCGDRFVVVLEYPSNGIQNGAPDGVALVDADGNVVEFLSYEGSFKAVGGPANDMVSTDIGVAEAGTTPIGHSLSRNGTGAWNAPAPNTFGACNDNDGGEPPPPPPPPPPSDLPATRFSEIHYDNFDIDAGERIEIEGPAGTALTGWSVVLYNGNVSSNGLTYSTRMLSGTIPAMCNGRGVVVVDYPQDGIQNGPADGFALVDPDGNVVEFLSYEGSVTAGNGPALGKTSKDIGVAEGSSTAIGQSLWRNSSGAWAGPAANTFGACNEGGTPQPPTNTISFSGRTPNDPALPVGFEDQIFATLRDPSGATVPTTFTWTSETPAIAGIDATTGVIRAIAAGTATFRATAVDGTTATFSLPTRIATAGATADYAGNTEFGAPADADAGDDHIVTYPQYTASYNATKGTPNWVSYNLEATHFGAEDRCDCFTFDPSLPGEFTRYTTADYTGAGTFHGYGIDRGHLARSFDRTAGSLDNARTFYFTNIIPQAADNNQGPWAAMESYLGDLARLSNKEVYIIAGVAGSKGTVKNEGKITIPTHVWKVALVMPRNQGLANLGSWADVRNVEVVAAIMPNDPGVRNVDWKTYKTTVDAVEALSGYDLLARLRDDIEIGVESSTRPPVAATDGPYALAEGGTVTMSAARSTDPDGHPLTYRWSFGDGGGAAGVETSHTYAQDGVYTVRLIATDPLGLADTVTATATVSNVAPAIGTFPSATLLPHETYTAGGSFTDPGDDTWSAIVDYGDGSGRNPLPLDGKRFSLAHTYAKPGTFTVAVSVSDDDAMSVRTQTVFVLTPAQGTRNAIDNVEELVETGVLARATGNSLTSKLEAAVKHFERDAITPAVNQIEAFLNELDALERSNRLSEQDAAPARSWARRVIRAVSQ